MLELLQTLRATWLETRLEMQSEQTTHPTILLPSLGVMLRERADPHNKLLT
jgi:hypothetical protein